MFQGLKPCRITADITELSLIKFWTSFLVTPIKYSLSDYKSQVQAWCHASMRRCTVHGSTTCPIVQQLQLKMFKLIFFMRSNWKISLLRRLWEYLSGQKQSTRKIMLQEIFALMSSCFCKHFFLVSAASPALLFIITLLGVICTLLTYYDIIKSSRSFVLIQQN